MRSLRILAVGMLACPAYGATFNTRATFPGGGDGLLPYGGLVAVGSTLYGTTQYGGAYGRGAIVAINATTGAETLAYSFQCCTDAVFPQTGLTPGGKLLYGISAFGGANDLGAVFSFDPKTGSEKVLFSLSAETGGASNTRLYYAQGTVYGVTYAGNSANCGAVFKVNVKTGAATTLHSFTANSTDGCQGAYGGLVPVGSLLYGATFAGGVAGGGVIFSIDPNSGAEHVVYNVGTGPEGFTAAGLAASGTTLYLTVEGQGANGGGTISAFDTVTNTLSVLHAFGASGDGSGLFAAPALNGGTLYGTTYQGGAAGTGTVYATQTGSGATTTLASFGATTGGSQTPVTIAGKMLYGTALGPLTPGSQAGDAFAIKIGSGTLQTLHSFVGPHPIYQARPGLIGAGSLLYGATGNGGPADAGTLYSFDPATNKAVTIYSFAGGADGLVPAGRLTRAGQVVYGVTSAGGASGAGTVFAFNTASATKTTLYSFTGGADGGHPNGDLVLYNGLLYGTTRTSASATGTIFSLDPATGVLTTVYRFTGGSDGTAPVAGLTGGKGVLYGTAFSGGANSAGTVFAFTVATAQLSVLHAFSSSDGDGPAAPLIEVGGVLYGTTDLGGSAACFCGTVFAYTLKTAAFSSLYSFTNGADGGFPFGPALTYEGGLLYGVDALSAGTVFSVSPTSGAYSTVHAFTGATDGFAPSGTLFAQGKTLFGTTSFGGTTGAGTIFSITP